MASQKAPPSTPPAASLEDLLTTREVSRALAVSRNTVLRLNERGLLPRVKIGGNVRYRRGDVLALIKASRSAS